MLTRQPLHSRNRSMHRCHDQTRVVWRSLAATVGSTALTRSSCFERHCKRLRPRRCNPFRRIETPSRNRRLHAANHRGPHCATRYCTGLEVPVPRELERCTLRKPRPIGSLHRSGCDQTLVTLAERHWRFGVSSRHEGCTPSMRNDRPSSALPREYQCKARRACVAGSIMQQALEKDPEHSETPGLLFFDEHDTTRSSCPRSRPTRTWRDHRPARLRALTRSLWLRCRHAEAVRGDLSSRIAGLCNWILYPYRRNDHRHSSRCGVVAAPGSGRGLVAHDLAAHRHLSPAELVCRRPAARLSGFLRRCLGHRNLRSVLH